MKKIEAVIFDWAGTTVDYGCFAPVEAFVKSFQSFGITPTLEEVRKPMGMLKREHIHTMMQMPRISAEWEKLNGVTWTQEDVDTVYKKSEEAIFEILHDYAQPKPFVLDTIATLRQRGIKIGSTTGYTDEMMAIVVPKAKENGYAPDFWFSPNSVNNMGRPYPYMIYRNMEALGVSKVEAVIKVGDTVSDILEGKNAGIKTVGIVEGSSAMGISLEEFNDLSSAEKDTLCNKVRAVYKDAGADYIIDTMEGLLSVIDEIERS